jgi:hypothetical protein
MAKIATEVVNRPALGDQIRLRRPGICGQYGEQESEWR